MNIIDFNQRDLLSIFSDLLSFFGIPSLFYLFKKKNKISVNKSGQKSRRTKKSNEWSLPFWSGKVEEEYTEGSLEDINIKSTAETKFAIGKEDENE